MRLLERDRELGLLHGAVRRAAAGSGSAVAVTGESGAGKSTLVRAACGGVPGVRVLLGQCDPLVTPRPMGPFRDMGLPDGSVRDEAASLAQMCEAVYVALGAEPTLVVVEDVHWVDAASVEVLRFLVRRIESVPVVLVVTYRGPEIGPRHAARPLLGDLAGLERLTSLTLPPLSVAAVKQMLEGTGLDALRVHRITAGNPFFVTEVAREPDLPLPASVRDVVLARTAGLGPDDFEALQLVATAPNGLEDRALPALGVDLPTLRRLHATTLLARTDQRVVFRHELARQVVEETVAPGGGPRLHARLLAAMEQVGTDPAILVEHSVGARDSSRAVRYAKEAAADAIRAGSHSEAASFLSVALGNLSLAAPPVERAELLHTLAFQQYMTSRLAEAIDNIRATFALWRDAGDAAGLARAYEAAAVFEYYNAHRSQAEAYAERAAETAVQSAATRSYGHAEATRGYLAYMRSEEVLATESLAKARRIAEHLDDRELALRVDVLLAANRLAGGEEASRAVLLGAVDEARAHNWDELASTGYSSLANIDVEQARYRSAERVLEVSVPFATERDIPICRQWQTAVRSRLRLAQGHWSAALEDAQEVLGTDGMQLATVWPHLVTLLVPLRRGEGVPSAALDAAWSLAERLDEPLRRMAVLAALAETAWMTGAPDQRLSGMPAAAHGTTPGSAAGWAAGNLAVWLHRLGASAGTPAAVAEPFRLTLEGRHADAASWWHRAGDPFREAMAWVESPEEEDRVRGVRLLDRLGAVGTADRCRVDLRQDGMAAVPARPRASTRANPAGLTNRQLDVARLVARGLSNAEIATRLYISPKTADHHVSAVLTKLALPSRRAVVVQAAELGLV